VDEDCLRSLGKLEGTYDPASKLLTTDWESGGAVVSEEFTTANWDGEEIDYEFENVGWMYI
jgi:hypothetical protein